MAPVKISCPVIHLRVEPASNAARVSERSRKGLGILTVILMAVAFTAAFTYLEHRDARSHYGERV